MTSEHSTAKLCWDLSEPDMLLMLRGDYSLLQNSEWILEDSGVSQAVQHSTAVLDGLLIGVVLAWSLIDKNGALCTMVGTTCISAFQSSFRFFSIADDPATTREKMWHWKCQALGGHCWWHWRDFWNVEIPWSLSMASIHEFLAVWCSLKGSRVAPGVQNLGNQKKP